MNTLLTIASHVEAAVAAYISVQPIPNLGGMEATFWG